MSEVKDQASEIVGANSAAPSSLEEMSHEQLLATANLLLKQRDAAIMRTNEIISQQQRKEDILNIDVMFRIIKERDAFPAEYIDGIIKHVTEMFVIAEPDSAE